MQHVAVRYFSVWLKIDLKDILYFSVITVCVKDILLVIHSRLVFTHGNCALYLFSHST